MGIDGSRHNYIDSGVCSDDFSEITVTSTSDKSYRRIKLE